MSRAGAEARSQYGELTSEQQSSLDRAATTQGLSVLQLMEIAGWQVARWVFATAASRGDPVLVVAGHGNNGGDGLVAARHLLTWGLPVTVALVAEPDRLGELSTLHLGALRALGATVTCRGSWSARRVRSSTPCSGPASAVTPGRLRPGPSRFFLPTARSPSTSRAGWTPPPAHRARRPSARSARAP